MHDAVKTSGIFSGKACAIIDRKNTFKSSSWDSL